MYAALFFPIEVIILDTEDAVSVTKKKQNIHEIWIQSLIWLSVSSSGLNFLQSSDSESFFILLFFDGVLLFLHSFDRDSSTSTYQNSFRVMPSH